MSGLLGGGAGAGNNTQQAPLSQFNVQSSAYGLPVPILYGRNRIPANLIWYGDFAAVAHTTTQSAGKGGGEASSTSYTYTVSLAMGLCEGAVKAVNRVWKDKDAAAAISNFTAFLGGTAQTPWTYLTTNHPAQALNYRGHAYVAAANYDLGSNANTGNHSFDVTGLLSYSASIDNANPADVLTDLLTNVDHGAGFNPTLLGNWSQFSDYCVANNLFVAPAYTSQQEARQHMTDLFNVLNSGVFFSEGKLKIVPFSDTTATANGITYTPNVTPVFSLTDDDYLDPDQPVKVSRTATSDAYNQVQIEYLDAAQSYNKAIAEAKDQASIEVYGLKPMEVISASMITDANVARLVAQLILQRVLFTRNMYEFKLSWKFCQLEPCDYVTLTDARLGLNATPVRVLSVEEDSDGQLLITAEDAPSGVSHSALYTPPVGSGYVVDYNAPVLSVQAPVFFETPAAKSLSGLAVGVAVTGQAGDTNWGGCEIYASNDGVNYSYMGRTQQPARYGALTTANITGAIDQTPRVLLSGMGGQILSGSSADAANDSTSCVIFDPATDSSVEYVDYTTATLNATNDYTLTLHLRGLHNTTAQSHNIGDTFVRVDGAIAYSNDMDLAMIGKTLYFKLLSFNIYGGAKQLLADVSAYSYTVKGNMASLPPPGVTGLSAVQKVTGIQLSWTNPASSPDFDHVEVWRGMVNTTPPGAGYDAVKIATVMAGVPVYLDPMPATSTTYYYWLRTVNKQGFPSAFTSSVTAATGSIGGIEIASTLPTTGNYAGRVVYLTTDAKIYRYNGAAWTKAVDGADILANSIVAASLNVGNLAAISASLGSISSGNITLDSTSWIKGGQSAYNTGTGFFLGYDTGAYKFSIGNPAGQYLRWTGTALETNGLAKLGGVAIYDVAGTYTFSVPIGVTKIWVAECIGAGGGGAYGYAPSAMGGGGGAGQVKTWTEISGFSGSGTETLTVTVGAGGAAGVAASGLLAYTATTRGGNGGPSSVALATSPFTSFVSCAGGFGGYSYSTGYGGSTLGAWQGAPADWPSAYFHFDWANSASYNIGTNTPATPHGGQNVNGVGGRVVFNGSAYTNTTPAKGCGGTGRFNGTYLTQQAGGDGKVTIIW